jgi:hypothetical protein
VERETLERVSKVEAKNAMALASTHEYTKGFVRKIALLENEFAVEHQAREVFEKERQAQFEEPTILQTWGSELCHAIVGPPRARHHLSKGMRLAALHHTEMVEEFAVLRMLVSSDAESVHGLSPNDGFHVEIVGMLAAEF